MTKENTTTQSPRRPFDPTRFASHFGISSRHLFELLGPPPYPSPDEARAMLDELYRMYPDCRQLFNKKREQKP